MGARVNYDGLVVAGVGFFLTRFTVTLAISQAPLRFYLAGVVPLVLGLGLAAFGVALAVADVEASLVRTTTVWCLAGSTAMLVLVVLTLLGSADGTPALDTLRSRTYLSNFLIGGSVGGTLTGLYASRNRQHRAELERQARRLEVLNGLLRHEVLNAVTVIQGYASVSREEHPDAGAVIEEHSTAIRETVEEVKYLTRNARTDGPSDATVGVGPCLDASVAAVRERYPDAEVSVASVPEDLAVHATERVEQLFTHLLASVIVDADAAPSVTVSVATTADTVRVSVRGDGPGLPERQRAFLETGEDGEFDDPGTGFRLNVIRLLVESYGGSVETADGGTTITVALPRADSRDAPPGTRRLETAGVRPALPRLIVALGAAVLAGVFYGVASRSLGGSVAGIGVFYGAASPIVGWITHEFHSVVFGFVFAGLVSLVPPHRREDLSVHVAVGVGWALVLWTVAAGVVAPVWLRLLGIPASIPNLSLPLLISHLAWGISLGLLTAWGYTHVAPWIARHGGRLPGDRDV